MSKKLQTRDRLLDAAFMEVYIHGYNAASTTKILKDTKIPKGSMYHLFASKKDLVLAVIKERIFPKMDIYFDFTYSETKSVYKIIEDTYIKMSKNEILIINGCPLHKLIVEMSSVDKEFEEILNMYYLKFISNLDTLLKKGIEIKEFKDFDTQELSKFIISATWGALSISPTLSSKEEFINNYKIILDLIKTKIA